MREISALAKDAPAEDRAADRRAREISAPAKVTPAEDRAVALIIDPPARSTAVQLLQYVPASLPP